MKPELSFIICTRNRAHAVRHSLDAVARAVHEAAGVTAELVVVNNGSTDGTAGVLKAWAASAPLRVKVIEEPRPGLAVARNSGIAAAAGRLLVFTDDDCLLDLCYVADLLEHDAGDNGPKIRGGRVELGDPGDLPFSIKREYSMCRLRDGIHPGGFILGCNMTMSRDVVERLGEFDERFGAGGRFRSGEDTEYLYRAYLAGIPVEYVPNMVVFHFHGRKDLREIHKLHYGYSIGNGALYAKYMFRSWRLLRHFYWDVRNSAREVFGGRTFMPEVGLTHRSKIAGNIQGIMQFWMDGLGRSFEAEDGKGIRNRVG
jgi:glycosyltransferase involved in cell wall biosynthesis